MLIFPAIDLVRGQAVRLFKGDYDNMTVYHHDPLQVALDFQSKGARCLHLVDLEGAKTGGTPNLPTIQKIVEGTSLFNAVTDSLKIKEMAGTKIISQKIS